MKWNLWKSIENLTKTQKILPKMCVFVYVKAIEYKLEIKKTIFGMQQRVHPFERGNALTEIKCDWF